MSRAPSGTVALTIGPVQLLAIAGFVAVLVGTFMPWAQAGDGDLYSKAGTSTWGIIAIPIAAVGALIILTSRAPRNSLLAAVCAGAAIGIGVFGIIAVRNGIAGLGLANDILGIFDEGVKVGNGLYILIGGAVVALVASLLHVASLAARHPAPN